MSVDGSSDSFDERFRRGAGPPIVDSPPEYVTPRWAQGLARALDDLVRIPGTRLGIGLDGVVGALLPGVGDALTGVGAVGLLLLALGQRVPTIIILRMVLNIAIDAVLGAVPLLGDVFDILWKSNRKNLELIERYRGQSGEKPTGADYAVVGLGVFLVILAIVLPLLVLMMLGAAAGGTFGS